MNYYYLRLITVCSLLQVDNAKKTVLRRGESEHQRPDFFCFFRGAFALLMSSFVFCRLRSACIGGRSSKTLVAMVRHRLAGLARSGHVGITIPAVSGGTYIVHLLMDGKYWPVPFTIKRE